VELQLLTSRSLRHGGHTHGFIRAAECRVDGIARGEVRLACLHILAEMLLLVGVEIKVMWHAGRVCLVVNHGDDANGGGPEPEEGGVVESGCALFRDQSA
jgi:hypothetical protein